MMLTDAMPAYPGDTNQMSGTAFRALMRLQAAVKKRLPHAGHLYLQHGRWMTNAGPGDGAHQVSILLDAERLRLAAIPVWRRNLTDKTADEVEAMCRSLLGGNPNSRFVREQYPQLFNQITAEKQE